MENINAYFASKITFIRYLLVILISSISIGVLAEAQNPKSIDGSWVNSGGRDHESAQNPRYTFEVTQAGEFDIRLESVALSKVVVCVMRKYSVVSVHIDSRSFVITLSGLHLCSFKLN